MSNWPSYSTCCKLRIGPNDFCPPNHVKNKYKWCNWPWPSVSPHYITLILKPSHMSFSWKVFKWPFTSTRTGITPGLDESLAEPLHNEKAPSVPRIEIPFGCRTWTRLFVCAAGTGGAVCSWGFSFMPTIQHKTVLLAGPRLRRHPPPRAHFILTCWRRQQLKLLCHISWEGLQQGEDLF